MSTSSPTARRGTPEEIRALVAFLNTEDFRTDTDALKTPRELEDWLRHHGLSKAEVTWADLSLALEVRDALRALLAAHLDATLDTHALRQLDEAARRARPRLRFHEDGSGSFASEDFDETLGRWLELVVRLRREGLWNRLKVCADETCRAVFYDVVANRSAKWCSRRCGDRLRARAYRRSQTYRSRPHRSVPQLPRIFRPND